MLQKRTLMALLMIGCLICEPVFAQTEKPLVESLADEVINAFRGKSLDEIHEAYADRRAAQPYPILKQLAISDCHAKLPVVSDASQNASLRKRLAPLLALFRAEERELIIFQGSEPNAFNLPGVALGFSTGLLGIIRSDDELAGIAAHELAHELFVFVENEKDFKTNLNRHRQVELMCDAVAVAALIKLGKDPAIYGQAIQKILEHSPTTQNINDGSRSHPSLGSRRHVIARLAEPAPANLPLSQVSAADANFVVFWP